MSDEKMTLEEYKKKYTKPENTKAIKFFLFLMIAGIGVIIFTLLLLVVLKVFEAINDVAGYISIGVALLIFILFYIVPVIKIQKAPFFITNINNRTVRNAKKHNQKVREQIADGMIDFTAKVEGANWYNDELVGKLAIARQTNNHQELKSVLTEIYDKSVKGQASQIIASHALQVGLVTAASQSDKLDAAFIALYELNLIKDLVYLYGFRPSNAKLIKIYRNVIISSLLSYGFSNASTNLISKGLSATFEGIPLLGTLISTAISSVSQGVINGVMTTVIGIQTKRYLIKEYHLQDLLDDIVLDDEKEDKNLIDNVTKEINAKGKGGRKTTKEK